MSFLTHELDNAWEYLEPKFQQLIRDELAVVTAAIDAEVESLPTKLVNAITALPVVGGILGGILGR